ncbi:hypothetical protein AB4212_04650 [Streptomyces sp. 2MCAF27]
MTAHLSPARVAEIRDLLAELVAASGTHGTNPPHSPVEDRQLLGRCRSALADLLSDREALIAANAEAAEELALWNGSLK